MTDHDPDSELGVRHTFETIATDFDRTRTRPWPPVEAFIEKTQPADTAVDIGCGNGRHLHELAKQTSQTIGIDLSRSMLRIARAATSADDVSFVEGSVTALPLTRRSVEVCIAIATLHHVPTRGGRIRGLDEIERILRPNGQGLLSVWSQSHDKFDADDIGDMMIDWTMPDGRTVPRYYHIYTADTFADELADSTLTIEEIWETGGNLYAIVRPTIATG